MAEIDLTKNENMINMSKKDFSNIEQNVWVVKTLLPHLEKGKAEDWLVVQVIIDATMELLAEYHQ